MAKTRDAAHEHAHGHARDIQSVQRELVPLASAAALFAIRTRAGDCHDSHSDECIALVQQRNITSQVTDLLDKCRHACELSVQLTAREQVGLLPHAVATVSAFIDNALPPHWTIPKACEHGHLSMLLRLAAREPVDMNEHYRAHLFSQGLVHAAWRGDLSMVQWLCCEYCPSGFAWRGMEAAAEAGKLTVLQWLTTHYSDYVKWNPPLVDLAAKGGRLEMLQWLHEHFPYLLPSLDGIYSALELGDRRIFEWLRAHFPSVNDQSFLVRAIKSGSVELVQYLLDLGYQVGHADVYDAAARSGCLEMVEWVHSHTAPARSKQSSALVTAASKGYFEIVQWFHTNCPASMLTTHAMNYAAKKGHLTILQWLHTRYPRSCSTYAMDSAARNGHLNIVQWLHANRTEGCTTAAMDGAAERGHLDVIKWLYVHRHERCSSNAVKLAAANGHLDVVQWFHVNVFEGFSAGVMDQAARGNHLAVVQWLHSHRSDGSTAAAMNSAASLEMVQWLHTTMHVPYTWQAMLRAITRGDFDLVLFLEPHQTTEYARIAARTAALYRHWELFQYFYNQCSVNADSSWLQASARLGAEANALAKHMKF